MSFITNILSSQTGINVVVAFGTALLSFIGHRSSQNTKNLHEERMSHQAIVNKTLDQDAIDVQNARTLTGPYQSTTRRYLTWGLVALVVGSYTLAPYFHLLTNEIITNSYSFLFIKWTRTAILTVHGILQNPSLIMLVYIIVAFYCGRITHKY